MLVLSRVKPIDGAFEPALIAFAIVVALGVAWVIWEYWPRDDE
jgi:hypothetical protein